MFVSSRVSVLGLIIVAGIVLSVAVVIAGLWWFPNPDFLINLVSESFGVILGGVVVAALFDGVGKMHRRQEWYSVRQAFLLDLGMEPHDATTEWMNIAKKLLPVRENELYSFGREARAFNSWLGTQQSRCLAAMDMSITEDVTPMTPDSPELELQRQLDEAGEVVIEKVTRLSHRTLGSLTSLVEEPSLGELVLNLTHEIKLYRGFRLNPEWNDDDWAAYYEVVASYTGHLLMHASNIHAYTMSEVKQ